MTETQNGSVVEKSERKAYKQKDRGVYDAVGARVKELRGGRKASEVACDGLSGTIIGKMEKGEALTLDNLKRFADRLGVPLSALFTDIEIGGSVPESAEPEADAPECEACNDEGCDECESGRA